MTENTHIKALVKAQADMGKLVKGTENPAFKRDGKAHKYADLGAVLETCAGVLHANGFAILQPSGKDELGQFTDTVLAHEAGGQFTTRVYWTGVKPDMQGSGSAMTYARRYGLMALTALAPEDDDGNEASKPAPRRDPPAQQVERDPAAIRDSLKKLITTAATADAYANITTGAKFVSALQWLCDNDKPKHLEVVAAMNMAEKSLIGTKPQVIDDSLPDFTGQPDPITGEPH